LALVFHILLTGFGICIADLGKSPPPALTTSASQVAATDWKMSKWRSAKAGAMQPGDVIRLALPRTDLKVTVGSVQLKPT